MLGSELWLDVKIDSIREAVKQEKYRFTIHAIERGKNEVPSLW